MTQKLLVGLTVILLLAAVAGVFSCGRTSPVESVTHHYTPGDVNLNEVANEVADAVLLMNYFPWGDTVLSVNYAQQVAAGDVNRDGTPLHISDLVYLIKIMVGDALPYSRLHTVDSGGAFLVRDADARTVSAEQEIGAVFLIVEGEVTPVLLVDEMQLSFWFDGNNTRICVFSFDGIAVSGDILQVGGNILDVQVGNIKGNDPPVGTIFYSVTNLCGEITSTHQVAGNNCKRC